MNVVLGSSSPRRRLLLGTVYHKNFTIAHPDIDETLLPGEQPAEHCLRLAESKIMACLSSVPDNTLVICADTIVTLENSIFGKPSSYEEAFDFLKRLQGRSHFVLTAFALALKTDGITSVSDVCRTGVQFKTLSDSQIEDYLHSIEYRDKAGAYAIQDQGSMIIDNIDGSLSNVVGFPVRLYFSLLNRIGAFDMLYNIHN